MDSGTEEPSCAAHMFDFNEDSAVPMKLFFSENKRSFPMVAVIVDGHCGETDFDCYENFQVIRIHCYSSQPRVICTDSRAARATDLNYYTMPVNTEYRFKRIIGHTSVGETQTMTQILAENQLPVMVKFANDRTKVKIDSYTQQAGNLGNLLIREKYEENYLMVHCIDGTELKMSSTCCMVSLNDIMTATPIIGLKNKSKAEYNAFLLKLQMQVKTNGEVYEKTTGNPAMSKYSKDEDTTIYSAPVLNLEHPTPLVDDDDSSDDYEEPIDPPDLPIRGGLRTPISDTASTSNQDIQPDEQTQYCKPIKKTNKLKTFFKKIKPEPPPALLPRKPTGKKVKEDSKDCKKSRGPYVNTNMPQAIVNPFRKDQGATNISQRKALPLPVTEEEGKDDVYEYPNTYRGDEESDTKKPPPPPVSGIPRRHVPPDTETLRAKCKRRSKLPTNEESRKQNSSQSTTAPVNENTGLFNINEFTIDQVVEALHTLKLGKYGRAFRQEQLDGEILANITEDDMVNELHMSRLEAVRLSRFIKSGHVPR